MKCETERRLRDSDWEKEKNETEKIKWRGKRKRGRGKKRLGFPCLSLLQSNQGNDAGTGDDTHMCIHSHLHMHAHKAIAPDHHLTFRKTPTAARLHHSLLCFLLLHISLCLIYYLTFPLFSSLSVFLPIFYSFSIFPYITTFIYLSSAQTSMKPLLVNGLCVCACLCI